VWYESKRATDKARSKITRRPSLEVASTTLATFFLLWPWTLIYDLDLWTWLTWCQAEAACQNLGQRPFGSKVVVRTHRQTRRHTHWTDCFTWTTKVVDEYVYSSTVIMSSCDQTQQDHSSRRRHWAMARSVASPAWVRRPAARRTYWTFDVKTAGCDSYFRQ